MGPKNGKQKNGARPIFTFSVVSKKWGLAPFSPPDNKTAPVCAPDEVQASPSICLGHMYKYFTFILHLSFIEDKIMSNNLDNNPTL